MRDLTVRASILLLLVVATVRADEQTPLDTATMRRQVEALGNLTSAPKMYPIDTASSDSSTPRRIYFEGLPYRGKPTRVFAWYGLPKSQSRVVPGVVLAHGGGGTAYREWVEKWNAHGFAAIAPALEGQTDEPGEDGNRWKRHEWAGPARDGIYADSDQPIEDQWMYHAVADVVLAHALLQANEHIDFDNIGLVGISWGGIVTSTVVGIDTRFAFAVPTYGCGYLSRIDNHYGQSLADNRVYLDVWEPGLRLNRAKMPMLWLTWLRDSHFPLDAQQASYRAAKGRRMVAVLPEMGHSHPAGWNPEDSYAFARSVINTGKPWLREIGQRRDGIHVGADFVSTKPIERAILIHTKDTGFTGYRNWIESPAELRTDSGEASASATLPEGTRAYFFNVMTGPLTASSEYVELSHP